MKYKYENSKIESFNSQVELFEAKLELCVFLAYLAKKKLTPLNLIEKFCVNLLKNSKLDHKSCMNDEDAWVDRNRRGCKGSLKIMNDPSNKR